MYILPWAHMSDAEVLEMRKGAAAVLKARDQAFEIYGQVKPKRAAHLWGKDYTTVKRWMRKGLVQAKHDGEGWFFLGVEIINIHLFGTRNGWTKRYTGPERRKAQTPFVGPDRRAI
jgi:hypothetical protein